jgi:aspartate kinase
MNREVGFGRRLLQIFEDEGVSYEHTPSGIDNMSVILHEDGFGPKTEQVVCRRILDELKADDVSVEHGLALLMIVGEGMHYSVGLTALVTRALADANVNIEMMNQGSSEISIMFGIKSEDSERAVKALYRALFEQEES